MKQKINERITFTSIINEKGVKNETIEFTFSDGMNVIRKDSGKVFLSERVNLGNSDFKQTLDQLDEIEYSKRNKILTSLIEFVMFPKM